MQYFQAVQIGKKRASEAQMELFKIAGFAMLTLTTKKFKQIELKNLRKLLIHEEFVAGGYDLMDIVALKIIERSKIKTRILKADIKQIQKAINGNSVGTKIIHS